LLQTVVAAFALLTVCQDICLHAVTLGRRLCSSSSAVAS